MSVNTPLPGDTEGVSAAVHPHLETAIRLCISYDPDQSVKENLFGEEILDASPDWIPPVPMALPEFELVVARALRTVGRDWLNLNLRAVTDQRRLVVLEYVLDPRSEQFVRPPSHHISINPSGLVKDHNLRCYPSRFG